MRNVIANLRARREDDERGFTLIELMVVVLIIAILIAIAIPTFLGARQRAQNRAAQSSLRNSLAAAKTLYTDNEDYSLITTTDLADTEPSLTFVAGATASTGAKEVSVTAPSSNLIVMVAESASGDCYAMRDNTQGPGTQFAQVDVDGGADCSAADANVDANLVAAWSDKW